MPDVRPDNKSSATEILRSPAMDRDILIAIAGMIFAIFVIDAVTPLEVPVWLLYFIPLFLAYWSGRDSVIPAIFFVTLIFLIAGYILSPQSIPTQLAIPTRFIIFLNVFFILSLLLWTIRGRQIREENL